MHTDYASMCLGKIAEMTENDGKGRREEAGRRYNMRPDIRKYCGKEIGVNQRSGASNHGYMHAVKLRRMVAAWADRRTDSELLSV